MSINRKKEGRILVLAVDPARLLNGAVLKSAQYVSGKTMAKTTMMPTL
ncbi:MAG: hypothetical protein ABJP70_10910 [Erythrobacter sp.]